MAHLTSLLSRLRVNVHSVAIYVAFPGIPACVGLTVLYIIKALLITWADFFLFSLKVFESFVDYVAVEQLDGDNKYDAGEHGLQVPWKLCTSVSHRSFYFNLKSFA